MSDQTFGQQQSMSNNYAPYTARTTRAELPLQLRNYSEAQLISFINDRIWGAVQASNFRKMVNEMPKYHRAYNGQFRDTNVPKWRSQLFTRFAFKTVEVLRAYMQDAIFQNPPYLTVDGGLPKYAAGAKNLEKLLDYEMYHTKFEMRMLDALNFALKYGTAPVKTFWKYELNYQHTMDIKRKKNGWVDKGPQAGKAYAKWDDPWFLPLDPRKVYPDPLARYTDEIRYLTEEYTTDIDQLYKDKDRCGYMNLEKLNTQAPGYSLYGKQFTMFNDIYPRNQWNSNRDENRKQVFISEYWGRLDLPGNQDDPRIYCVMLANNRTIIKVRPNPYAHGELPYQFLNLIPQEENLYGIGAIEPILTDNYVMNALVNMRIDAMQYFINPRILVSRGALADKRSIEWSRPGEIINVNSTGDLDRVYKQFALQDTGMNSFRDQMDWHQRHGEETMAVNPNAAGVTARSGRSATEASMAMSGANARFNAMVRHLKYSGLDGMVRQYGQLCQQYVNEKHFPIFNPVTKEEKGAIMKVSADDIAGEMYYRIKDNTITNKDIRSQLLTNMIGVIAPYAQTLQMDFKPLLKGLLELSPLSGEMNLDQIFPEQQPEIMNQENSSLEKLAGQEGQPGAGGIGGMANGTTPMATPNGLNPQLQNLAQQSGGGLF